MLSGRYILPLIALLMVGCIAPGQQAEVKDVDPAAWFQPAEVTFSVEEITTISKPSHMNIVLRCDNSFSSDSVELMLTTVAPDGVQWCERHVIDTEENSGEMRVIESLYRDNIQWSQEGEYKLIAQPLHLYSGITAVGVNIIENK